MNVKNWEVYSGVTKAEGNGQGTLQSFLVCWDMVSLKVAFLILPESSLLRASTALQDLMQ